jgi:hypothetical protein
LSLRGAAQAGNDDPESLSVALPGNLSGYVLYVPEDTPTTGIDIFPDSAYIRAEWIIRHYATRLYTLAACFGFTQDWDLPPRTYDAHV